jgi:hypothetical protein
VLGRNAKAVILFLAVVALVVEGFLIYRWYDHYAAPDTASGVATGGASASEKKMPGGTAPEETTAAGGTPPNDVDAGPFVHTADDGNSRGDYTYFSDPRIDGDPDAVVLAAPSPGRGEQVGAAYGRNIGVWYEPEREKWAIFNQDMAAVPAGATFEVAVPPADQGFVHRAAQENTAGNATYLDDPLTNGRPDAEVSVTQNWNPGGGVGVYNGHPVGVRYDGDAGQWVVYNEDGAPMPEGAAFNVAVPGAGPAR